MSRSSIFFRFRPLKKKSFYSIYFFVPTPIFSVITREGPPLRGRALRRP